MQRHWMQKTTCILAQWIPIVFSSWRSEAQCIPIECSGVYAAWRKASRLMAVDIHALWLNKVLSMQRGEMHPDWTQWRQAAWVNGYPWNAVDSMQRGPIDLNWMQGSQCSVVQWILIECSGFHASWRNGSQLNAVKSMQRDWMQCIPCSLVKCIPIECSGFHAAWLNAVDSMQPGKIHPDWMQ